MAAGELDEAINPRPCRNPDSPGDEEQRRDDRELHGKRFEEFTRRGELIHPLQPSRDMKIVEEGQGQFFRRSSMTHAFPDARSEMHGL
ncbi:MAG TPA: hypothetical protein VGU20_27655 [Stellaceae bacterium]|nr:hypothetical protein [Stellaceae bacterium]